MCKTVHVDHSKSQPTDNKLSVKGVWSLSRDLFNFWKIRYMNTISRRLAWCIVTSVFLVGRLILVLVFIQSTKIHNHLYFILSRMLILVIVLVLVNDSVLSIF